MAPGQFQQIINRRQHDAMPQKNLQMVHQAKNILCNSELQNG